MPKNEASTSYLSDTGRSGLLLKRRAGLARLLTGFPLPEIGLPANKATSARPSADISLSTLKIE